MKAAIRASAWNIDILFHIDTAFQLSMFNLIADVELLTFVSTRIMVECKHDCVFNLSECKYTYLYKLDAEI